MTERDEMPAGFAAPWPADDRYAGKKAELVSRMRQLHRTHPLPTPPAGLTDAEANVLHGIDAAARHGCEPRPGAIGRFAHVRPSALSQTLGSLEQKGLITRERDGSDLRSVVVRLTEAGRAKNVELTARLNEHWTRLFDYLGERDVDELLRILGRVVAFQEREADTADAPGAPFAASSSAKDGEVPAR